MMNEFQKNLLEQVKGYVSDIFEKTINFRFPFHNLEHTKNVVRSVKRILKHHSSISTEEQFTVLLAAWFHDTGFKSGNSLLHETESEKIATDFLVNKVDKNILEKVVSCIQATRMPQNPQTQIEKILCDADLYHLGTNKFKSLAGQLKKELKMHANKNINNKTWREMNIQFLKSHQYFTQYCKECLEPIKQKWLNKLENKPIDSSSQNNS